MVEPIEYSLPDPTGRTSDLRDVHERIGRALCQVVALSHRIAFEVVPDGDDSTRPLLTLDDLRQIRPDVLDAQDDAAPCLAKVGPQLSNVWAWFRYLVAPESDTCARPAALGPDEPGRWLLQTLPNGADCGTHRYLAHVEYLADQVDNKELVNRCRNKTPAVFISLTNDDLEVHSQTNAYHKVSATYRLRVMSANFHGGVQARFQSPLPIERQSDPGTQRIIGDLRRAFIFNDELMHCPGVVHVALQGMRPTYERSAERIVVDAFQIKVIAYTYTSNAPCEVVAPWVMWVQLQDEAGEAAGPPFEVRTDS